MTRFIQTVCADLKKTLFKPFVFKMRELLFVVELRKMLLKCWFIHLFYTMKVTVWLHCEKLEREICLCCVWLIYWFNSLKVVVSEHTHTHTSTEGTNKAPSAASTEAAHYLCLYVSIQHAHWIIKQIRVFPFLSSVWFLSGSVSCWQISSCRSASGWSVF